MSGQHPTAQGSHIGKAQGFTLVETVVVLTLLGMAAAFAVPRYTNLANRTRASEVLALSADLREAAKIAHAQFVSSGSTLGAATLNGKSVFLKNGYPAPTSSGIGRAIVDWGNFTIKTGSSFVVFFKTGAPIDAQCSVTYQAASEPSAPASITDIKLSGC